MNSIFTRRSVRNFENKPVEKEKIELLLKAAMQAPSAGNQRPWEFIVVQEKVLQKKLAMASPYASPVKEAPVSIIVLGNMQGLMLPDNWQMDLSAATQNILLEAVELELGAVWLGIAPVKERMDHIIHMFNLPKHIVPFAIVSFGYPCTARNQYIDRYEPSKVHHDKYE